MEPDTVNATPQLQARAYFVDYLPTLQHQLLIEDLHTLDATCAIELTDCPNATWLLVIEKGRLTQVLNHGATPQAIFQLSADTLLEIVSGARSPQEAFFAQHIELEGDLEMGMKLSLVLAPFFRRFPYTPVLENGR